MSGFDDLAWLAEEACMNAWPCPRQVLVGGFLLRASGGPTRRTNSVNPLRHSSPAGLDDPAAVIAPCERIFRGLGRPAIFRVPSLTPWMDRPLERRGYARHAPSLTLLADLDRGPDAHDPAVALGPNPGEDWLAARSRLNDADPETDRVYRAMTKTIALPKAFAALAVDEAIAAMAYAALDRSLVVIESVGTLEAMRGRGLGRRVVSALMRWGRERGAGFACLQVTADNRPARALYESLGFQRELSRYHYRRRGDMS